MKIFKTGGSYFLKTAKYELIKDGVDGIKDSVIFERKDKREVTFLVGRRVVINNNSIEVEYRLTRVLTDKYRDNTDNEIAKIIAENPKDVTEGFYGYIASMITTIGHVVCTLPPIFTSTEYTGE